MSQDDKKYSILDELKNSNGYDIALMTTFNFEIGFFERAVLNRLYACDVKKVSLFVDSKELNKALKEVSDCYLGKRYMVTPVEMSSSFHPKVILLLGPKKAKLFVGSANIKTSGYAINNEIFNFKEYSLDEPKYLDIINTAIDFFSDINERSLGLDSVIIKEAKNQLYYHKADSNGECFLINNMKDTILNQATRLIDETIKEVRIAVPYYDNGLAAFTAIKEKYADAGIRLYIQDKKSSFPVDLNEKTQLVENIELFSGFENGGSNCCDNFYHGKVFLFKGNSHDYILYGSANCTKSALTKSFEDGGNIECDLLEVGTTGEFDYFFEGMKFISGKKPESNIMTFDANEDNNFLFRYGQLKESVELHIGYAKRIDSLKILLQDLELKHEYQDKEIIVYLPEEYRTAITDIFELSFISTDGTENVRCWYYNAIEIESYRLKQSDRGFLDGFEIDTSGEKYMEDRIKLLKAELTSLPEFLEHKKNIAIYNQIKQEQDGEDLESSDDDFIVDVPITDEYRASYRQYTIVSKIRRQFIRQFLLSDSAIFKRVEDPETKISNEGSENNCPESEKHYRSATSAEKRFERFVKGKVTPRIFTAERIKTDNLQLYYVVDKLIEAVLLSKKVRFQYQEYDAEKRKVLRNDGEIYINSPYGCLWNDDNYYLIGYSDKWQKVVTFRIDRIIDLELLDEDAVPEPEGFTIADYVKTTIEMYDGIEQEVELVCDNDLMKLVIDKFGVGIKTERISETQFNAMVTVATSKTFYAWAFRFAGQMRIAGPENVRKEYLDMARKVLEG